MSRGGCSPGYGKTAQKLPVPCIHLWGVVGKIEEGAELEPSL